MQKELFSDHQDLSFVYCNVGNSYKRENLFKFIIENGFSYNQSDLRSESFSFANIKELEIKKRIEKVGIPLKDWDINIYIGVLTGFNEAFIISTQKKEEILNNCKDSIELEKTKNIIKPILRGRDIKKYSYEWADLWLIGTFPTLKLNIDEYPSLKNYLKSFGKRLEQSGETGSRKKTNNKWFETQDTIAYYQEFEKEKIVYPCIMAKGSSFAFDDTKSYPPAPANIITGKNIKYIITCLNSTLIYYSMRKYYMGGGIEGELKINNLEKIPIPQISEEKQKPFIELVEKIIEEKQNNLNADVNKVNEWENDINKLVYELYGLTEDEIKIVEENKI